METTPNEAAVPHLKGLGFGLPNIRRVLLTPVGEAEAKLVEAWGVTRTTEAAHLRGGRAYLGVRAPPAQELAGRPAILPEDRRIFGQL